MAKIHIAKGLTGGGLALDGIRTAAIADTEMAFVQKPNDVCHVYRYDASKTGSEDSPNVIIPNDNDTGTGAWVKVAAQSTGADYGMGHWRYTTSAGVDAGAAASSGTIPLNEEVLDEVTSAGGYPNSSYQALLPAGTYRAWGYASGLDTGAFRAALYDATGSAVLIPGSSENAGGGYHQIVRSYFFGFFTISSDSYIQLNYWAADTTDAYLGYGVDIAGLKEVHAEMMVWRVA